MPSLIHGRLGGSSSQLQCRNDAKYIGMEVVRSMKLGHAPMKCYAYSRSRFLDLRTAWFFFLAVSFIHAGVLVRPQYLAELLFAPAVSPVDTAFVFRLAAFLANAFVLLIVSYGILHYVANYLGGQGSFLQLLVWGAFNSLIALPVPCFFLPSVLGQPLPLMACTGSFGLCGILLVIVSYALFLKRILLGYLAALMILGICCRKVWQVTSLFRNRSWWLWPGLAIAGVAALLSGIIWGLLFVILGTWFLLCMDMLTRTYTLPVGKASLVAGISCVLLLGGYWLGY